MRVLNIKHLEVCLELGVPQIAAFTLCGSRPSVNPVLQYCASVFYPRQAEFLNSKLQGSGMPGTHAGSLRGGLTMLGVLQICPRRAVAPQHRGMEFGVKCSKKLVSSSRPGRPPKRSLGVFQDNARLLPHSVPGLLSPGLITPTGITAAAMAEAMKLQKMKLMAMNTLQGNGNQNGTESEPDDLNSNTGESESSWDKDKLQSPLAAPGPQHGLTHAALSNQPGLGGASTLNPLQQNNLLINRLDLPFMMMPHPLLPVSLPPASVAMAMNQMSHLNTIANMAAAAQIHSPLSRAGTSVIKEWIPESPSPVPSLEDNHCPGSQISSHPSSSVSSSPSQMDHHSERTVMMPNNREELIVDQDNGPTIKRDNKEEVPFQIPMIKSPLDKIQLTPGQTLPPGFPGQFIFADSLSSVETLLTNIQGLLKVALDNAHIQEKQIQQEKKELRMELYREREIRENLERQLAVELQSRTTMQKRLKKEKKAKRKLQEALEFESKRREQVEQALKQATTSDGDLRRLKDTGIPDIEIEKNGTSHDSTSIQDLQEGNKLDVTDKSI
ncbi:dachshund homolog 2 [Lynx canadensis]|uniref:dachshund homolog 2 n=1 Tax=Lynx canadensis TaxID=61383 RepID=UPI0013C48B3B|nr:dachshund homolog 2 [Lynx canadensis]